MCSPTLLVTGLSTAVGMAGQYFQYQQQAAASSAAAQAAQYQAQYQAQLAENEKSVSMTRAQNELSRTAVDRDRHLRSGQAHLGEMRSQMGASGFELSRGAYESLLADSAENIQHDANIITSNGAQSAWEHQVAAIRAANDANWANYQASRSYSQPSRSALWLDLGGTLLGGLGKGLDQHQSLKKI